MDDLAVKAFDFGIRIIELSKYLEGENRRFALIDRLLECGTGVSVCLRAAAALPHYRRENHAQAFKLIAEAEYLLELMVITGVMAENQSRPILSDCRYIRDQIGAMAGNKPDKPINTKNNKEESL